MSKAGWGKWVFLWENIENGTFMVMLGTLQLFTHSFNFNTMPEGLFVTRTEWNQLIKKINYLEDYIKNSMQVSKSRWVTQQMAMDEIGCKKTKIVELRQTGKLDWRYAGNGKGIMILRKSIESYNLSQSTLTEKQ